MALILIRHGESEGNVNPNIYKTTRNSDIELTRVGKEQSIEVGKKLNDLFLNGGGGHLPISVFSSTFKRAKDTAILATEQFSNPVDIIYDPLLVEQCFGGISHFDYETHGNFYFKPEHGESGLSVYTRIKLFILVNDIIRRSRTENILIFSHGFAIKIFLMVINNWTPEEYMRQGHVGNAKFVII